MMDKAGNKVARNEISHCAEGGVAALRSGQGGAEVTLGAPIRQQLQENGNYE